MTRAAGVEPLDPDLVDLVRRLVASGHTIVIDTDAARVEPAVSETIAWLIDNAFGTVRLILEDDLAARPAGIDWDELQRDIAAQLRAALAKRRRARRR